MAVETSIALILTIEAAIVAVEACGTVSTLRLCFQAFLVRLGVGAGWAHDWISSRLWTVVAIRTLFREDSTTSLITIETRRTLIAES